ncbi:MAG: Dihydrolipoamide dehydrogenase [Methanothrix sp.]|jgi:dihydrolipoamide dehydrogenase|nr:MAG: Dihydrolipoamide dehydrogenase [Methanothrix sp.]
MKKKQQRFVDHLLDGVIFLEKFDLIVIGSGAGLSVASEALKEEMRVALMEHGPLGGTCFNTGCIPSKMLIYPADVIRTLEDARAVGIEGHIDRIDIKKIMERTHSLISETRSDMEEQIRSEDNLTWYRDTAEFVGDHTLKSGDVTLTAPNIVIASGARPLIPPIPGLKEVGFIDHVSLLDLERLPKSLIVVGGGYIGCEYAHFFSAVGTKVTLIGRNLNLLPNEDPEISSIVKRALSEKMTVYTGHEVSRVENANEKKLIYARNIEEDSEVELEAEEILMAVGRRSNSDLLKPEMTGVKTDSRGWIVVDEYLQTTKPGIWALGDALGKHMFRHTANYEADVVSHNMLKARGKEDRETVDYHAVPHAVFSYPPVAAVGMTESEASEAGYEILVGRSRYTDAAKGIAMAEDKGFVKAVVEEETTKILGVSVVGSEAPTLAQQVVYLMNSEYQDLMPLIRSQVIHPTINEVLYNAFANLKHPHHHAEKEESKNRGSRANIRS